MMDEQLLTLLMQRFDRLDGELAQFTETFREHAERDAEYWRKIDQQEGAMSVWKWIAGLGGGSGLLAVLSQWFGKPH